MPAMVEAHDQADLLDLIRERIVGGFQPLRLVLFGPRARGNAQPHSDVDLLVVLSEVTEKRAMAIQICRALRDLPVGKDIIVTTPDEIAERGQLVGSVLRPALREGRTIFERT